MTRGGKREGAGKPKGIKHSDKTVIYYERCTPAKKDYLKKCSEEYKEPEK